MEVSYYLLHGSLQCYERRGKEVIGSKETKHWSEVTPSMMSDEEEQGDTYIRHPPRYRSTVLAQFIDKLDGRYEKLNSSTHHPRKKRVLGCSLDVPIPPEAKKWMVKPGLMRERAASLPEIQGESDVNQASPTPESQVETIRNQTVPLHEVQGMDQTLAENYSQGEGEEDTYSDHNTDDEQESDELF